MNKKDEVRDTQVNLKVTAAQNGNGRLSWLRFGLYLLVLAVAVVGYVYATNGNQDRKIVENTTQVREVHRRVGSVEKDVKDVDKKLNDIALDVAKIKVAVGADEKKDLLSRLERLLNKQEDKE